MSGGNASYRRLGAGSGDTGKIISESRLRLQPGVAIGGHRDRGAGSNLYLDQDSHDPRRPHPPEGAHRVCGEDPMEGCHRLPCDPTRGDVYGSGPQGPWCGGGSAERAASR